MITLPSCSEAGADSADLIQVNTDHRGVAAGGIQAAHLVLGLVGAGSAHRETRDALRQGVEIRHAAIAMSDAVTTVMLMGVSCASVLRFVAVTTIVANSSGDVAAGAAVADGPDC